MGCGGRCVRKGRHKLGMLNVPQTFADMTVTNAKHAPQFQTQTHTLADAQQTRTPIPIYGGKCISIACVQWQT